MMPSNRRLRTIAAVAVCLFITILFFTRSVSVSDKTFYDRTVAALQSKHDAAQEQARGGTAAVQDAKLREAHKAVQEEVAADAEERRKKDHDHDNAYGGLNSEHGVKAKPQDANQKIMGGVDGDDASPESNEKLPHEVGATQGKWTEDDAAAAKDSKPEKTDEEHEVDAELTSILKRSPIIIFSKSYCPYSKKAKAVFAKYSITPAPFIVELDLHPLGSLLQDKLLDTTGRRTVPNVLISGKSIGGGDDVAELDHDGKLIDKIKTMGGKRIMEVKLAD